METVREMLTYQYPYPHDHTRHAALAVIAGCLFFVSSDNIYTFFQLLDSNIKWWSIYVILLGFFYIFASPFLVNPIEPNYANFNRWYVLWLLVSAIYHLPSFQSMGVDFRMNVSLFLTLFLASVLILVLFHISFLGLWYLGLAPRLAGKRPEILLIAQNSAILSIACCVFYTHCGNRGPKGQSTILVGTLLSRNMTRLVHTWPAVQELKEQVCTNWLGPVGSAGDYPVFSKYVVYGGELVTGSTTENISPVFSFWATFIGLYVANYFVERSSGWALTHPKRRKVRKVQPAPEFLDMVPWYSGTSADLFKTAFDLLISVTLFLGRFDLRTMQAAMSKAQQLDNDGFLYQYNKKEELWFDFMADTGDGGNSTYTIARLLAQPSLKVRVNNKEEVLGRSSLLVLGGDLAYPNPSPFSYSKRLFRPFEYALQPPAFYRSEHIAPKKPELPEGVPSLEAYEGPQCFAIPGNHDWFDGLDTFMRYICHKSWFGGWMLPQEKSYFALQLPQGWWIFGLDQALHGDIDLFQFRYFSELAKKQVGEKDCVIIVTHEPNWLLDWYWGTSTGKNVGNLIREHLKGRCRVRLSGDLHFYMRHIASRSPERTPHVQHLIVSGCGGAFLHPTHAFTGFSRFEGTTYKTESVYPTPPDSRKLALGNILKFRKKNWRFDIIGGVSYFVLVFSFFPRCNLDRLFEKNKSFTLQFIYTIADSIVFMVEHSYVSLAAVCGMLLLGTSFVPGTVARRKRILIGFIHSFVHLAAALTLMLLIELGVETCVRSELLGTAGYHTLYEWYRDVESRHFPDPTGLRDRIEHWTGGFYPACLKYLMSAFDVPEVMAVTRNKICSSDGGINSLSRGFTLIYYGSVFLYFWVFSTPIVSFIFGSYLYISINWLNVHFDEAFSSLRIENFKSFMRCRVTKTGDLEVFTLAVDKVPKDWTADQSWEEEQAASGSVPSYQRKYPSRWIPSDGDPNSNIRVIDHFVISKEANSPVA